MDSLLSYDSNEDEAPSQPETTKMSTASIANNVKSTEKIDADAKKARRVFNLPLPSLLARASQPKNDEEDEDEDTHIRVSSNKGSSLLANVCTVICRVVLFYRFSSHTWS
jgi:hypothetical protein